MGIAFIGGTAVPGFGLVAITSVLGQDPKAVHRIGVAFVGGAAVPGFARPWSYTATSGNGR